MIAVKPTEVEILNQLEFDRNCVWNQLNDPHGIKAALTRPRNWSHFAYASCWRSAAGLSVSTFAPNKDRLSASSAA